MSVLTKHLLAFFTFWPLSFPSDFQSLFSSFMSSLPWEVYIETIWERWALKSSFIPHTHTHPSVLGSQAVFLCVRVTTKTQSDQQLFAPNKEQRQLTSVAETTADGACCFFKSWICAIQLLYPPPPPSNHLMGTVNSVFLKLWEVRNVASINSLSAIFPCI